VTPPPRRRRARGRASRSRPARRRPAGGSHEVGASRSRPARRRRLSHQVGPLGPDPRDAVDSRQVGPLGPDPRDAVDSRQVGPLGPDSSRRRSVGDTHEVGPLGPDSGRHSRRGDTLFTPGQASLSDPSMIVIRARAPQRPPAPVLFDSLILTFVLSRRHSLSLTTDRPLRIRGH
jgi:hypothetical protein